MHENQHGSGRRPVNWWLRDRHGDFPKDVARRAVDRRDLAIRGGGVDMNFSIGGRLGRWQRLLCRRRCTGGGRRRLWWWRNLGYLNAKSLQPRRRTERADQNSVASTVYGELGYRA